MRDNWQEYKLSDLAKFRRGSFPQPYGLDKWYDDENGHPFIQVYDVSDNMRLKETTKRRISNAAAEQSVFIPKGTIILTIQGSIGRIAITHYDAYMDRTLLVFQSFLKPTDKRYFMYVVHRLFEVEKEKAHGSTIKTITKEQLSSFTIPFPSLPEQQKIAEILSTVDAKIEIIDQQITETQELKKGLMQQLLTKGIAHTEFKDSALGKIPKSWEVVKISKVAHINNSSLPNTTDEKYEFYYIDLSSVKSGKIETPLEKIKYSDSPSRARRILKRGDVIMATVRPNLLGFAFAGFDTNNYVCSTGFALLSHKENSNGQFIYQNLYSESVKSQINKLIVGSNYPAINSSDVKNIRIPFPSLNEQNQIAEILTSVDDKLEVLSEKKITYQELKQGLMQQLLTGKVRV